MKKIVIMAVIIFVFQIGFSNGRFSPIGLSFSSEDGAQYPARRNNVYGLRFGLVGGNNSMIGTSIMVFANVDDVAYGSVGGLQIASFFNIAQSGELGVWQISGFHNSLEEEGNGLQVCGFYNLTKGYFNGVQIALYNEVNREMAGIQIGLVNKVESLIGIQIGLLNFVSSSMMDSFPIIRIGWGR